MKKITLRLTALLLALLMMLSMAFVACDESDEAKDDDTEETDGNKDDGNKDDGNKDDDSAITASAKELLEAACDKFVTNTAVEIKASDDYMGEKETDTSTVFTNADGDVVYYEVADVGNNGFEYTYSVGMKEYMKGPWGIDENNLDEKLTFATILDDIFDYIFDSDDTDEVINNLCKAELAVKKVDGVYVISLDTDDASVFFEAIFDEEEAAEMIQNMEGVTGFNGKVDIEFYEDGNFKKIALSFGGSMEGQTMSKGVSYEFDKYNDSTIKVEEPDWVTEYKNSNSGDDDADDNDEDEDYNDNKGDTPTNAAAVYDTIVNAMKEVEEADTLEFYLSESDGFGIDEMTVKAVKEAGDNYKIIISSGETANKYIDANGNLYEFDGENVVKYDDEDYDLEYILETYLSNYGFEDIEDVVERMCDEGFVCTTDGKNTVYTLNTDYEGMAEIFDPESAGEGLDRPVKGSVEISYEISSDGKLDCMSFSVDVEFEDIEMNYGGEVDFTVINGMLRFEVPEWVKNA